MKTLLSLALIAAAHPALAASGPFFSLKNTNFVVLLAFLVFVGVLIYFKVPAMVTGMLDKRAEGIRADLDEARALREEAQSLLASYERKHKEVTAQASQIVEHARKEALLAAETAKADLRTSIARRIAAAEEQIKSAETAAVKEVRDTAVTVAVGAARDLIAANLSAADGNKLIEDAIADVETHLH